MSGYQIARAFWLAFWITIALIITVDAFSAPRIGGIVLRQRDTPGTFYTYDNVKDWVYWTDSTAMWEVVLWFTTEEGKTYRVEWNDVPKPFMNTEQNFLWGQRWQRLTPGIPGTGGWVVVYANMPFDNAYFRVRED